MEHDLKSAQAEALVNCCGSPIPPYPGTEQNFLQGQTLREQVNECRKMVKNVGERIARLHNHPAMSCRCGETPESMKGEMHANLTLAYRHLEDARMRLGKVLQAKDGGVSILDKINKG